MESMGLNEIRKNFLDFFESKGHYVGKSASLIPKNDKSILIINSGMAPLKPYFAGIETPPKKRMTTCQKCIRTGDIDNVGKTARHGTFFEMCGNFSFGDYFKKESLTWGVEFLTTVLKFPMDKLWATVYLDDEQAIEIWKSLGMDESHIVRLGKEDNFWEIGLGPCGPDSEIFYDRGEEYGCGKPDCKPGCDCDRFIEVWNHVFTQFSKEEDGSYSNLPHPNIDTGMGLERMACVMQGTDSIFDVDTIRHILNGVVEKSGVKYEDGKAETDISIRIITDHLRAMTFMIADGIMPSNEGRGYVLRRLLRRAARHGRILGIKGSFLVELSNKVIEVSGEAYPELVEKKDYIQKIIQVEEENFAQTIDKGEEIIAEYLEELKKNNEKVLPGDKAFKLYDTYGFPLELTEEILEKEGISVDEDGFKKNMQDQKELARKNRKSSEEDGWDEKKFDLDFDKTNFIGYTSLKGEGIVKAIITEDGLKDLAKSGEKVQLILDQTPFYAEMGGQVDDNGIMLTSSNSILGKVVRVTKTDGYFYHTIELSNDVKVGDGIFSIVNITKRNAIRRNHTATHLLQKALRETLGTHVEQSGSMVNDNILRFDFSHFQAMTKEELNKVESIVNQKILEFMPVITKEMSIEEAKKTGAMQLFGEKYGSVVRVVNAGDWSIEFCGGTHVDNTGEIGSFKILSEGGVAAGVRRIEATTGTGVLNEALKYENEVLSASEILKVSKSALVDKVKSQQEELNALKKELESLKNASLSGDIDELITNAKMINGVKLITKQFKDFSINDLRNLSDQIKAKTNNCAMIFSNETDGKLTFLVSLSDDVVEKGNHAGNIVKQIATLCGGGGGGKADMAQAGAKDLSKIDEAFKLAETLIK